IKRENGAELAPTPQEYQETAEEFKPNPERIIKETNKLIVELASAEEALIPGHLIINQIGESLQECLREIKEKFAVKNIQVEFPLGKLSGPEQQNVSELQLHILPFQEENYSYKNPEQKSREYLRIARELKGVVMEEKVVREQQAQIIQQGTIIPSPEKVRFEKLPGAANKRAMKTSFVFDALGPGDYERLGLDKEKYEKIIKDRDDFRLRKLFMRKEKDFYKKSPFLSIAEDLLEGLKEDLISELVFVSASRKGVYPGGGDPRKREKFAKTFAHFPQCKLDLILLEVDHDVRGLDKEKYEKIIKDRDDFRLRKLFMRKEKDFYKKSPFLSIAEDLLEGLKEDLISELVFVSASRKGVYPGGGDPRKREKFAKTFAHFPQCKLDLILLEVDHDVRGTILEVRKLFPYSCLIMPDYKTNFDVDEMKVKDLEKQLKAAKIANHGTQPFNSLTTPPLTLKNIEAITTTNSYLLKLTLAENIQYHDEVSNIMYFLPFAEDAENKHEPDAEAFFYFITKLNQTGLKIDDYNFASYLKQNNITPNQYTNYKENKTPQEQLDYFFDKSQVEIINLKYLNFKQPSELIIDNYPELKEIRGEYILNLTHQLTTLDLSNCDNLERIDCSNNQLTQIKLPKGEKLKMLHLSNNNLSQDLFFLSGLVGLKELRLENNPFYGSLEPLKGMSKLEKLDISYTDIDSGLEYLPDSLEKFDCSANTRKDAKVKAIEEKLEPCGGTIQEKQINYLEIRVQELVNLIKNQKEKIALAYTHFCSEKETLQKLIKLNLEFTQFKERETNSPNYDEKSEEYEEQINELKKQLRSKLTKENMNEVRLIIKDCEELVSWELELEAKTNGKIALEFTKESQTIHILGNVNVVQGGHALIGCKLENNVDLSYNKLIELPEENNPKREKRDS
ncbi:9461_t:CDS:2, partial [Entrophospora sp. SA101]